jgi:hypothetical protein
MSHFVYCSRRSMGGYRTSTQRKKGHGKARLVCTSLQTAIVISSSSIPASRLHMVYRKESNDTAAAIITSTAMPSIESGTS